MKYVYTPNPAAAKPVVLVDQYIGRMPDGTMGIDGTQFAHEILSLKDAGKSTVEVWINSKGGRVSEGYSMHAALMNSGVDSTTINMGVVDSTAGWVYLAGKRRLWAPHALALVHEVTNASGEVNEEVSNSVAQIIADNTKLSFDAARSLMKEGRILNAQDALTMGFAHELLNVNVNGLDALLTATNANDTEAVQRYGKVFTEKLLNKSKGMNLNELLGLTNDANETAQYEAINKIITARNEAQTALATATNQVTELTNANTALLTERAEALVSKHVGTRISDDAEAKAHWSKLAIADYEGTKKLIESLNVSIQAPAVPDALKQKTETPREGTAPKPILNARDYAKAGIAAANS